MVKTKELVICIISIIALILAITTNVFATTPDIGNLLGDNNTANNEFKNIPDTPKNNANGNNTIGNNTIGNNTIGNNTNTIPNTGVTYSSLVIIAICGISAVYAYKKIREYNV